MTHKVCLAFAAIGYIITYLHRSDHGIEGYTVWALFYMMLLVMVTMKIRFFNVVLEWFRQHIFSVYILQRIPMIILSQLGLVASHKYLSLAAVFALTAVIAAAFDKATDTCIGLVTTKKVNKQ